MGRCPSPASLCWTLMGVLLMGSWVLATKEAALWIDDGHGHTVREPLSPHESKAFKQSLLATMGLPEHRPHMRPKHTHVAASASTFMKGIYETLDESGLPQDPQLDPANREALSKADTVVSFPSRAPPERADDEPPSHHAPHRLLYFDTSEVPLDHTLLGAELRLHYRSRPPLFPDQHLQELTTSEDKELHVYLVLDGDGGEMEVASTPLPSLPLSGGVLGADEAWVQLNMTTPALAWILSPKHNRGLRLAVTVHNRKHELPLHTIGISTAHDRADHRPILVCFFTRPFAVSAEPVRSSSDREASSGVSSWADRDILSRAVRSLPLPNGRNHGISSASRDVDKGCQMRPLHVSFSDLNWQQWVIAPDGYDANFCKGHCEFPIPAEMNATNHAYVQTLINVLKAVKQGDSVPPSACCAPKELATMSVLYYDYSNNVVLKKYPKMIVKNCACM